MAVGALVPTFLRRWVGYFCCIHRIGVVNRIFVDSLGLAQGPFNIASILAWVGLKDSDFPLLHSS